MTTGRINQVDARAETQREIAFTPRPLYDRNSETELRRRKAPKRNPVEMCRASQTLGEAERLPFVSFAYAHP